MDKNTYFAVLRILAAVTAVCLWMVSVSFSVSGFNFEVDNMVWAGYVLAFSVTVLQLVWSKVGFKAGLALIVGGILAYVYGIVTNVIGIMAAQGAEPTLTRTAFDVALAVMIEVIPESLLVWALIGTSDGEDVLSHIFGFTPATTQKPKQDERKDEKKDETAKQGNQGNSGGNPHNQINQHKQNNNHNHQKVHPFTFRK